MTITIEKLAHDVGAEVVGVDREGDQLRETLDGLPGSVAVVGDVTSEAVMDEACERGAAVSAHGLRAFVANAGIARPGPSVDYPLSDWDQLIAVDLTATFLGARAACRRMADGGAIVMISSELPEILGMSVRIAATTAAPSSRSSTAPARPRRRSSHWPSDTASTSRTRIRMVSTKKAQETTGTQNRQRVLELHDRDSMTTGSRSGEI